MRTMPKLSSRCLHAAGAAIAVLLIGGCAGHATTDRDREGLKGPVRQVETKAGATTTIQTYDGAGALVKTVTRILPAPDEPDAQEQLQTLVYRYDPQGRPVRETTVDADGQQYPSRLYAVDEAGRTIAEAAYHMCGTFSSLHVYAYARDGRLREDLAFQYRMIKRQVFDRNAQGQIVTATTTKNGVVSEIRSYRYDEQGNPISEKLENMADPSLNATTAYTYEYDARGNWIKRTARRVLDGSEKNPEIEVTERTIHYGDQ